MKVVFAVLIVAFLAGFLTMAGAWFFLSHHSIAAWVEAYQAYGLRGVIGPMTAEEKHTLSPRPFRAASKVFVGGFLLCAAAFFGLILAEANIDKPTDCGWACQR